MTHQPIFPAGIHVVEEAHLESHFLHGFSSSATRPALLLGLRAFLAALRAAGVAFEVWLDGSFCTYKVDPNDVDVVVFGDPIAINGLSPALKTNLQGLLDRANSKTKYGCDVLFAPSDDPNWRSYWRGWYGFDRAEQPKGIACLSVSP